MMRPIAALRLACVVLLSPAGCMFPLATVDVERRESFQLGAVHSLAVESRNGGIEVFADDDCEDLAVEALIRGAGHDEDEARVRAEAARLVFLVDGGVATLRVEFDVEPRINEGASLVLRLPPLESLRLRTSNGEVVVEDTHGDLEIRTSNSGVTVRRHDGAVAADTSNGEILLQRIAGPVRADTSNAGIAVLESSLEAPLALDTSNGDVHVELGSVFKGELEVRAGNGEIHVERTGDLGFGPGKHVYRFGDGPRSRIETSNGSVTIL
jgi:hypothetical protein